jgi:hypothetical protein
MTTSLKVSLIEPEKVPVTNTQAPVDGLAELKALASEIQGGKPKEAGSTQSNPGTPGDSSSGVSPTGRRRKFKKVPPENTIRLTIRQYWRLRDWMARRSLGLPSEYAGVFIQGNEAVLVEPMVEPIIGCLDAYLPEEWVVFIEDKSPVLMLLLALFEAEQTFGQKVAQAAAEIKAKQDPAPAGPVETGRPKMPSLNETIGKEGRVTA